MRMAQCEFLCDHSTHRGANHMSSRYSRSIQHSRRILCHQPHPVRSARRVASPHAPVIEENRPVAPAQNRQDPKPHVVCETQTHNEQHRLPAAHLVPINVHPAISNVRHSNQRISADFSCSLLLTPRSFLRNRPTTYMVQPAVTYKLEWSSSFTPPSSQGSIEIPPRISQRNGISVCSN